MTKRIYVEQLGGWWSFSLDQWRHLLRQGIEDGGHVLPEHRQIKKRPDSIGSNMVGGVPEYYAKGEGVRLYQPLDWEQDRYQSVLDELKS